MLHNAIFGFWVDDAEATSDRQLHVSDERRFEAAKADFVGIAHARVLAICAADARVVTAVGFGRCD